MNRLVNVNDLLSFLKKQIKTETTTQISSIESEYNKKIEDLNIKLEEASNSGDELYFKKDGNFADIINKLGKQPSDFTINNFGYIARGINGNNADLRTGDSVRNHGYYGSGGSNLSYNNTTGVVSGSLSVGAWVSGALEGSTNGFTAAYISVIGYIFDPSDTPFI